MLVVEFADLLDALAATPAILRTARRPSRSSTATCSTAPGSTPRRRGSATSSTATPAPSSSSSSTATTPDELPPRLDALEADLDGARGRLPPPGASPTPPRRRGSGSSATLALGLSMAEKGDAKAISFVEDTAVAPEHLRDYIAEFLGDHRPARHQGRGLRPRLGRLPARPAGDQPQDRGGRAAVRGDRRGGRRPGAQVRRRALGRARRRPGPQPVPGEDVRPGALPGVPRAEADVRPAQPAQPRQDRRRPAAGDEPAVRPGLRHARRADHVRLLGRRRPAAGRRAVRGRRRVPQDARGDDVPVVPGDPRRAGQHPRPGQRCCGWRSPASSASTGFTDPHVHEVLDLCLECKACKGECPTNVDMARLKAEFLHQYHREHGLPWRNRVFGHVARLGRSGCRAGARCRTGWRRAGSAAG